MTKYRFYILFTLLRQPSSVVFNGGTTVETSGTSYIIPMGKFFIQTSISYHNIFKQKQNSCIALRRHCIIFIVVVVAVHHRSGSKEFYCINDSFDLIQSTTKSRRISKRRQVEDIRWSPAYSSRVLLSDKLVE
jgi:hypothetical protein